LLERIPERDRKGPILGYICARARESEGAVQGGEDGTTHCNALRHVCVCVCVCKCLYVYIYICLLMYIHMNLYMYINAFICRHM